MTYAFEYVLVNVQNVGTVEGQVKEPDACSSAGPLGRPGLRVWGHMVRDPKPPSVSNDIFPPPAVKPAMVLSQMDHGSQKSQTLQTPSLTYMMVKFLQN